MIGIQSEIECYANCNFSRIFDYSSERFSAHLKLNDVHACSDLKMITRSNVELQRWAKVVFGNVHVAKLLEMLFFLLQDRRQFRSGWKYFLFCRQLYS